jgi:hypothetical protein
MASVVESGWFENVLRQPTSHLLLKSTNSGYGTVLTAVCARQGCSDGGLVFYRCYSCIVQEQSTRKHGRPIELQRWRAHGNEHMEEWKIKHWEDDPRSQQRLSAATTMTMLRSETFFNGYCQKQAKIWTDIQRHKKNMPMLQHFCWGHRRTRSGYDPRNSVSLTRQCESLQSIATNICERMEW